MLLIMASQLLTKKVLFNTQLRKYSTTQRKSRRFYGSAEWINGPEKDIIVVLLLTTQQL